MKTTLSPEDLDLVRRDAKLPGLTTVLDPQAFVQTLNAALPKAEIVSAIPLYARYKPQMNLLIQHEITTANGEKTTVYAKAYGPDAPPHLDKARRKPGAVSEALGAGRFVIEEEKLVVVPFPNDARLKQLRYLEDPGKCEKILRSLGLDAGDSPLEALRYKPERRYVAKHFGGAGAVVKFYAPGDYDSALVNASTFKEGFKTTGPLRLAGVVGTSGEYSAIATGWVGGLPLEDALRGRSGAETAKLAGEALSELHAQEVRGLKFTTRQEEANALSALASGISFTLPDVAGEVYKLVGRLAPGLLAAPLELVPIHGDFYDEQAIVSSGGEYITVLDLDRATFGDSASDLGNFAAHLEVDSLRGEISPGESARLEDALLDGYDPTGRSEIRGRFALYKAAGMLKLAPMPFRRRWSDWPDATRRIISRAAEILP